MKIDYWSIETAINALHGGKVEQHEIDEATATLEELLTTEVVRLREIGKRHAQLGGECSTIDEVFEDPWESDQVIHGYLDAKVKPCDASQ